MSSEKMGQLEQQLAELLELRQKFLTERSNLPEKFLRDRSPDGEKALLRWLAEFGGNHQVLKIAIHKTIVENPALETAEELDEKKLDVLRKIAAGRPVGIEEDFPHSIRNKLFAADIDEIVFDLLDSDDEIHAAHNLQFPIDPIEFVRESLEIGSLVFRVDKAPRALRSIVDEARSCFALGQYRAVFALSRTALEFTCRDVCERLDMADVQRYQHRDALLAEMILDMCEDARFKPMKNELIEVKNECNRVIHARPRVSRDEAKGILRQTFGVLHRIFDAID